MVNFNFSFDPGTTVQQMLGFELAGRIWSAYLTDNMTVNIHVGVAAASGLGDVIGGALPGMRASQSYESFYTRMTQDRTSADDALAVSALPTGSTYGAWYDMFVDMFVSSFNQGGAAYSQTLNLSRANAKALGILGGSETSLDGYILFSDLSGTGVNWSYDYTRSQPAPARSLDFLSTAVHEIGHVLGFISGIDKPGWLSSRVDGFTLNAYMSSMNQRIAYTNPLDLFRYSQTSRDRGLMDLSYGSQGGSKYFSLNRGWTQLAQFSTGADTGLGGDGQQASHWKNNSSSIMAPTLATGQRPTISALDLRAFDVIGYNLSASGISTRIDLSGLLNQSVQQLAQRAGQSTTWINSMMGVSPTALTRLRITDVGRMIVDSQMYEWDWSDGSPFWQRVVNLFREVGVFSTLGELDLGSDADLLSPTMNLGSNDVGTPTLDLSQLAASGVALPVGGISPQWDWGEGSMPWAVAPGIPGNSAPQWDWGEGSMPWAVVLPVGGISPQWDWGEGSMPWVVAPGNPDNSVIVNAVGSLDVGVPMLTRQYWSSTTFPATGDDAAASEQASFNPDIWAWDWQNFS